jgi:hypothetical protein
VFHELSPIRIHVGVEDEGEGILIGCKFRRLAFALVYGFNFDGGVPLFEFDASAAFPSRGLRLNPSRSF